jgi:hypothetical protein
MLLSKAIQSNGKAFRTREGEIQSRDPAQSRTGQCARECSDFLLQVATLRHSTNCDREGRADSIGNVSRSKMAIVLLNHPRIGVTELRCDDGQGHTFHNQARCVRMAKAMNT